MQDPAEPNVMNARVNQRIIRGTYELPKDVPLSRECQDLLSRIFVTDPKRRIKAPQMKQHPFLAGVAAGTAPSGLGNCPGYEAALPAAQPRCASQPATWCRPSAAWSVDGLHTPQLDMLRWT